MNKQNKAITAPLGGLIPPQAVDVEELILAALMLEKTAYFKAAPLITADSFYTDKHRIIYTAIQSLVRNSNPVDLATVKDELAKMGKLETIGGLMALVDITNKISSAANIEKHAAIIQQKYLQREMIRCCGEAMSSAYSDENDVFDVFNSLSTELYNKMAVSVGKQAVNLTDILEKRITSYTKHRNSDTAVTGLSSGFVDIDRLTGGWQNTDLIILAARPAMGKTALGLNFARNASKSVPVAVFSLEMSKEQLTDRVIAAESGIFLEKIKKGKCSDWEMNEIGNCHSLFASTIMIDDSSSLPIMTLRSKAMQLKQKHDIGLVVIDYLQLMVGEKSSKGGNREQEISSISRGLKALAKDLNIPVIALSQLSRAVESRPGGSKRPMLSDLRESGAIEQDADQVLFLFRPEYYGITADENGDSTKGLTEVIIAKNRHGETDTAMLNFDGAIQKFNDWDTGFSPINEPWQKPDDKDFRPITLTPNSNFDNAF